VEQRRPKNIVFLLGGAFLTLLLLVAAGELGVSGVVLNLFVAVPVAYVHMRFGLSTGGGALALVVLGAFLLGGATGLVSYLLQFGIIALVLPFLMRQGWPWDRAVAASVAVIMLASTLALGGYAAVSGTSVTQLVDAYADAEVEQAMSIYAAAELPEEQVEELRGTVKQLADFLRYAYPGLAITVSGFLALLVLWLLNALRREHYKIPGEPFGRWKASELLIWPLIAAGFGMAFLEGVGRQISVNVIIVLLPVYFLQGLAIVTHYFNRRQVPPILRGFGYVMITFLNPLPLIVTGIGVFDIWIDFRKPRVKKT